MTAQARGTAIPVKQAPITRARITRVIAVTSGKGGVGKSTVSINLAAALSQRGERVVLLDADLGLANIDVLLGLAPTKNLQQVLDGSAELNEILLEGPVGVQIVPASSGIQQMTELSNAERAGLIQAFSELDFASDWLVIDTAAGIAANTLQFCDAAQEIVIVICDDPASLTDAYATIKVLHQTYGRRRFRVLVNMVRNDDDAGGIYQRLLATTDRFLEVILDFAGCIPFDRQVVGAARRRMPVLTAYPDSAVAASFKKLAAAVDRWPRPQEATGRAGFFWEKLIQADVMGRHVRA